MASKFMPFEMRTERTIVQVNVYPPIGIRTNTEVCVHSREYDMTDHEWCLFLAQLDTTGVDYKRMNCNVIVITKIIETKKDK